MTEPVAVESSETSRVPVSDLQRFALDTVLYCHTFFPRTFRQRSAPFHKEVFATLENPNNRQVGIEIFRGGAKTTMLRVFTSKRIAYGISRTIMFVSASQAHSLRSVRWLRKQIEYNHPWREFFGLEKGNKWTDEHLEINHKVLGFTITIIAAGITGQVRGVNIDDYRPDLIVVDDADDEETTATPEQRDKTEKRFFGAVANSLTPASENPEAMMALLATSQHKEDLINKCHLDPSWNTVKFPILDENNESIWATRFSTEVILADKAAFIARGQILIWLREWECTTGDEETADFKRDWLQFWDVLPDKMIVVVSCDPAPPPSEIQIKQGLKSKDEEVWSAVGLHQGKRYLLEQQGTRDPNPEWSVKVFFEMVMRWQPLKIVIETIAYQRTLKALLESKMKERKQFYVIDSWPPPHMKRDKRKKRHRIMQSFSGIASQGQFFCSPAHQEFISQFAAYPNVGFDDRLDSPSIALEVLNDLAELDDFDELFPDAVEDSTAIEWQRSAP